MIDETKETAAEVETEAEVTLLPKFDIVDASATPEPATEHKEPTKAELQAAEFATKRILSGVVNKCIVQGKTEEKACELVDALEATTITSEIKEAAKRRIKLAFAASAKDATS